jgi:hypothetical protein
MTATRSIDCWWVELKCDVVSDPTKEEGVRSDPGVHMYFGYEVVRIFSGRRL